MRLTMYTGLPSSASGGEQPFSRALRNDQDAQSQCSGEFDVTLFAHGLQSRPRPKMANRCNKFAGGVMDDPTACWHRYLVSISALDPDEDEATQALIQLVQWLRVGGRPPDGFTASEIRALVARLW